MATSKAPSGRGRPAKAGADGPGRVQRQHRSTGQARRDALLEAAIEVIATKGMAGVTHRAVTDAAGVPLATVSYFFDSITDLAAEAIRVSSQRRIEELRQLVDAAEVQLAQPDAVNRQMSGNRMPPTGIQAMVETYLIAGRMPEMRQCAADMLASVTEFVTTALRAAGAPEPESMARAFAALSDGYSLHSMASADGQVDTEDFNRANQAMFLGYLLLQGHTDQAMGQAAALTQQEEASAPPQRRRKPK